MLISGVRSRVTILITHIGGLITHIRGLITHIRRLLTHIRGLLTHIRGLITPLIASHEPPSSEPPLGSFDRGPNLERRKP